MARRGVVVVLCGERARAFLNADVRGPQKHFCQSDYSAGCSQCGLGACGSCYVELCSQIETHMQVWCLVGFAYNNIANF